MSERPDSQGGGSSDPPPFFLARRARVRKNAAVTQLLVKVLLAPSFVVGASVTARRFGPRVGGLVAGLPVVAGPILLAYALAHGSSFAAGAAAGTLLGLVSLIAFSVAYGRLAARLSWAPCMLAGWLTFVAFTALFSAFTSRRGRPAAGPRGPADGRPRAAPPPGPGRPFTDRLPRLGPAAARGVRGGARADADRGRGVAGPAAERAAGAVPDHRHRARDLHPRAAGRRRDGAHDPRHGHGFAAFALFFFTLAVALRPCRTGAAFVLATGLALAVLGIAARGASR